MSNLIMSGYDGTNDIYIFIREAYRRCEGAFVGEPIDFYEFEDNLIDVIIDSKIIFFTFKGFMINKYEINEMLEDIILNEFRIEFTNSFGEHKNNSQIIMFEEMIV
ncbi:MAG: hypothetical protein N2749_00905 [Clostridia bacterium]|nr:hypothetical protein [Clostridia bacterium]